ncbi:MAG: antibiotic biosynthesis monooxygenase [Pseudomonadota bacterium]|nr:antibiotic biosynthesis monooxygenase [Pseudomonadota bacterium]
MLCRVLTAASGPPMIVTVFRSRLKPEAQEEYAALVTRMVELSQTMPGYVSQKRFTAEDGERVTIVEFATEEGQRAWATHPEHLAAMQLGRERFYSEFKVQVCDVRRTSTKTG